MTATAIDEHDVTVYLGDAAEVLAEQAAGSVQCIVTSPPYFGLRDYGTEPFDWPEVKFAPVAGLPPLTVPAQRCSLGLESDPWAFVAHIVFVMREARRVLADDGVLWLNLGDTYSTGSNGTNGTASSTLVGHGGEGTAWDKGSGFKRGPLGVPKNLMGIPWRVALALQGDGWILRNAIIWNKPNSMPESVTDRLSTRYEQLFLFSKSRRYWFDLDPIREETTSSRAAALTWDRDAAKSDVPGQRRQHHPGRTFDNAQNHNPRHTAATDNTGWKDHSPTAHPNGKNPGDVWAIPTSPFPGAHFACMPPELARRCILAGCPEDGTVYDPFTGSGTTAMVARSLGRRFVGSELNPDYIDIIRRRIGPTPFDFAEVGAK